MKRIILLLLALALVWTLCACGQQKEPEVVGGETPAENPEITQELRSYLEAAVADYEETFEPVALVSTQVVAGTNYVIACDVTDAQGNTTRKNVKIYVDLQQNSSVLEIMDK